MKTYTKEEKINYLQTQIAELKQFYPIPNMFRGFNVEESKADLQTLIEEIETMMDKVENGLI